jgi:hypothetical protein
MTPDPRRIFCVYPETVPSPGHCPACAALLDELGCRIIEAHLTTPAERLRTGVTAIYEVRCNGTPVIRMASCPFAPHQ